MSLFPNRWGTRLMGEQVGPWGATLYLGGRVTIGGAYRQPI
jgi:hypothetical protein